MSVDQDVWMERVRNGLWGLFVGDALAMPGHWYYRPAELLRDFPPLGIDRMLPAPATHPGAIMSLHSTSQGGRRSVEKRTGGKRKHLIGDVILVGRRSFWEKGGVHYHQGMPAGENTLNAWCARWLMEDLADHGAYDARRWLDVYVEKMTVDPCAHPDTYAESYHRAFFANWVEGVDPMRCGGVTHDTASIGALVTVGPLALALLPGRPVEEVQRICREHALLTHPDALVGKVVEAYVVLLSRLLFRETEPEPMWFLEAASAIPGITSASSYEKALLEGLPKGVIGRMLSIACYLDGSWPIVCYLAARAALDREGGMQDALLENTALGGDNVHRGSVLGVLTGLMHPPEVAVPWAGELRRGAELSPLIAGFLNRDQAGC